MERIHVTVRARPLSAEEANSSPWRISGNSVFVPNQPAKFDFDRVFGAESTTGEVYGARTKEIVAAAVRGFNGTVFAYGQTNSGKTHTMRGSVTEPGVIPRAVSDLFDMIEEDVDREFLLRMSYMEIYNEDINDLLAPEHRKLQIHENLERGIYVAGLREEIVVSQDQVLELMRFGESHRHIGETNMNTYSSRSHTIFRMIIESRDKIGDDDISGSCDAVRVSVLNMVDLAGSERAAKTGAEGVRLKEGSHINKSLMTLGTVIQKLSEGAESQGGHVPYRDSKLTRILQPALGGNANTAIICNITLAQIHADETKSSLQFASRALRVTNHAHVNEILTDAALLKRQKKEIEELREKLQGSRSEHLEKEILNLRNTLLQSELERERISLELEEEKRVQAEREKVLQEQAKKIKNLSSMVLCSNKDGNLDQIRKGKRRDTWCPSNLSRQTVKEPMVSAVKSSRLDHGTGPLLPFEEVLNELELQNNFCPQHELCDSNAPTNCNVPEPRALLHVTSRRKVPSKKKGPPTENHDLLEMQTAYEELYLKSEIQKTVSHVKIDCLTRQLAEANVMACPNEDDSFLHFSCRSVDLVERGTRESDAILVIKQLQEKIKMLEMEKSASQQNLDNVVELATDQNELNREKLEELLEELQKAQEEARIAHEWLVNDQSTTTNELAEQITEFVSEIQSSKETVHSVFFLIHDMFQTLSSTSDIINEFKALTCSSFSQEKMVFHDHEIFCLSISEKAAKLEGEKVALHSHLTELQGQLEELRQDSQKQIESLEVLVEQHELEKEDCISQIQILQNEISCLSNCSLFKEKESLRKDLEKAKSKLKETESKMKNAIQEKTKLEGEKAVAEKKISRLQGQNSLLERDIQKCESLAGRRRDSVMERGPKVSVPRNALAAGTSFEQTMQEDYQNLEVLLFEMEATIASLEEQVTEANKDRDEALCKNEGLMLEIDVLLKQSSAELNALREEVSGLRLKLEESISEQKRSEDFIKSLSEEKEELALQLADALLEIEEERTIWSAKETGSISAINEQAKLHKSEITSLFEKMSEVKHQFESCKEECNALRERVTDNEKCAGGKKCRVETFTEIDQVMENQGRLDDTSNEYKQLWEAKIQVDELNRRISAMEAKMQEADIINGKVKAKLRMRLKGTQAKLDTFRLRHNEVVDETAFMNKKFEDASEKLKGMVASLGKECLNLKKQLAACRCHSSS